MRPKNQRTGFGRLNVLIMLVLLAMLLVPLSACQSGDAETGRPADYGSYGSRIALSLAARYPYRSPGSTQERQAGDLIIRTLEELGYEPVVTTFYFTGEEGQTFSSRNISIAIPGQGFIRTDEEGASEVFRRQVIVGAHYDTHVSLADVTAYREAIGPTATPKPTTTPTPTPTPGADPATPSATAWPTRITQETLPEPTLPDYDGIHDNASGIGALLTLAREIREEKLGYDVILVAFGAGEAAQAGARAYVGKMTKDEISLTDAMYCIDAIYAGDKVYAHAGRNSLRSYHRKVYEMRRKLYEVTDVFYEHSLFSRNGYMLYTNQGNFDVYSEDIDADVLYREWTLNESDYLPFDEAGIPIVFFESYDYDGKNLEDLKESKNPAFSSTGGMIRHTRYDTTAYLQMIMNQRRSARLQQTGATAEEGQDEDRLTRRINNTAFVILEAIRKGVHDAEMLSREQGTETAGTSGTATES